MIAYFVNLRIDKIRNIFDDCKSDNDAIEHLWSKFLSSDVLKSVTLAKMSAMDGRATSVTIDQLRKDFDHVIGSIIKKYGKLNSLSLEKL